MRCHLVLSYGCPWTGVPCCLASSRLHQQRPDAGGDGDSDGDSDTDSVAPAHSLVRACTPCRVDRADMCPHTHRVINISTDHIHTVTTAPSACIWHTLVIAAVTMAVAKCVTKCAPRPTWCARCMPADASSRAIWLSLHSHSCMPCSCDLTCPHHRRDRSRCDDGSDASGSMHRSTWLA